jgi:hypothetical protein
MTDRIYNIWYGMIYRCTNPKCEAYPRYGGRGITVCDEWLTFSTFKAWAHKSGYASNLTLERVDNSKGYNPGNCKWATPLEQGNNKRNNIHFSINGINLTVAELSRRSGLNYATIIGRVRRGWTEDQILGAPIRHGLTASGRPVMKPKNDWPVEIDGISRLISEWAKLSGLSMGTIRRRIKRGWENSELLAPSTRPRKEYAANDQPTGVNIRIEEV